MQTPFASPAARTNATTPLLQLFARLLALEGQTPSWPQSCRRFYRRAWCPRITLWYLLWQRLAPQHTLAVARTLSVGDRNFGG
jgi:hypothetical protein